MAEKEDPDDDVSLEELTMSNIMTIDAVVSLLIKKGIITAQEVMEEMKHLNTEH